MSDNEQVMLLSLRPEYTADILSGDARYIFRKVARFDPEEVDRVIIYSPTPVQRLVGEFDPQQILEGQPSTLWKKCKDEVGDLRRKDMFDYFDGQRAFAIEVSGLVKYKNPIDPTDYITDFKAPSNYKMMTLPTRLEKIISSQK